MAESAQIQTMSHRHQSIADWMLLHPEKPLSLCAEEHGVTQPWLSTVIHSDVFREYWAKRRSAHEVHLRERLTGAHLTLALKACEKMGDIIDKDDVDGRLVLDTAERMAKLLGFEPTTRTRVVEELEQTGLRPVKSSVLAEARERMTRRVIRETILPENAVVPVG